MHIVAILISIVIFFLIVEPKKTLKNLKTFFIYLVVACLVFGVVFGGIWIIYTNHVLAMLVVVSVPIIVACMLLLWGIGINEQLELKKEYETLNSYDIKTKEENERLQKILQKIVPAATGGSNKNLSVVEKTPLAPNCILINSTDNHTILIGDGDNITTNEDDNDDDGLDSYEYVSEGMYFRKCNTGIRVYAGDPLYSILKEHIFGGSNKNLSGVEKVGDLDDYEYSSDGKRMCFINYTTGNVVYSGEALFRTLKSRMLNDSDT